MTDDRRVALSSASAIGLTADVGRIEEVRRVIYLAMRATQEVDHLLVDADSWAKDAAQGDSVVGHLITSRAHVEQAMAQALRVIGLCAEAIADLKLLSSLHREAIAEQSTKASNQIPPPSMSGGK